MLAPCVTLGDIAAPNLHHDADRLALHRVLWAIAAPMWAARACHVSIRRWEERDMPKSSSHAFGAKTYYRPIEAAVRWCGLLRFEQRILEALEQRVMPEPGEFPRWPLLRLYVERIFDALCAGASGYLLKKTPPAKLIESLREAFLGGAPMSLVTFASRWTKRTGVYVYRLACVTLLNHF